MKPAFHLIKFLLFAILLTSASEVVKLLNASGVNLTEKELSKEEIGLIVAKIPKLLSLDEGVDVSKDKKSNPESTLPFANKWPATDGSDRNVLSPILDPKTILMLQKRNPDLCHLICEFCGADSLNKLGSTCIQLKEFVLKLYKRLTPIPWFTSGCVNLESPKVPPILTGRPNVDVVSNAFSRKLCKIRQGKNILAPTRLFQGQFLVNPFFDPHRICKIEHKGKISFLAFYVQSPHDFEWKRVGGDSITQTTEVYKHFDRTNLNSYFNNPKLTHCLVSQPDEQSYDIEAFMATGRMRVHDCFEIVGSIGGQSIIALTYHLGKTLYLHGEERLWFGDVDENDHLFIRDDVVVICKESFSVIFGHQTYAVVFMLRDKKLKQHVRSWTNLNLPFKINPIPSIKIDDQNIVVSWKRGANKFKSTAPEDNLLIYVFPKAAENWKDFLRASHMAFDF